MSFVWDSIRIYSEISVDPPLELKLFQLKEIESINNNLIRQISEEFSIDIGMIGKTFFTTPGGDWTNPSDFSSAVSTYLPGMIVGENDGPAQGFSSGGPPFEDDDKYDPKPNQITQTFDFESEYPFLSNSVIIK